MVSLGNVFINTSHDSIRNNRSFNINSTHGPVKQMSSDIVSGGSSGGSAVSVQTGMALLYGICVGWKIYGRIREGLISIFFSLAPWGPTQGDPSAYQQRTAA
jgi:hypothetical protein